MKKLILILTIVSSLNIYAQPKDGYQSAMMESIASFSDIENMEDYQQTGNRFQRIAQMNPSEWLPLYYQALTRVYMSFGKGQDNDERDAHLEIADELLEKAEQLSENNVELVILDGYINMAKLSVNPAIRGVYMSSKVTGLFEKALAMSPENPRAMVMLARMKYGTAQFFKSGIEEPCALADKSLPYFETENDNTILPHWGEDTARGLLKACAKNG